MDEQTVAERGLQPLLDELAAIDAADTPEALAAVLGQLQRTGSGRGAASTSTPTPRTRRAIWCTSLSPGSACPTSRTTATRSTPRSWPHTRSTSRRCSTSSTARRPSQRTQATAARIVALETKLAAGALGRRETPRRRPDIQPADIRRPAHRGAGLRLGRLAVATWASRPEQRRRSRCAPARLPDGVRRAVGERGPRRLEAVGCGGG